MTRNNTHRILDSYAIRACYSDTDAAGVIHHARILEFFERSRTEWLHRLGAAPGHLAPLKLLLIIREISISFQQTGRLDDLLFFSHHISHLGNSQFTLMQSIHKSQATGSSSGNLFEISESNRLASAQFQIVCVNTETLKSTSLPSMIRDFVLEQTS